MKIAARVYGEHYEDLDERRRRRILQFIALEYIEPEIVNVRWVA